jgi:hypothetical protein
MGLEISSFVGKLRRGRTGTLTARHRRIWPEGPGLQTKDLLDSVALAA